MDVYLKRKVIALRSFFVLIPGCAIFVQEDIRFWVGLPPVMNGSL